MKKGTMRVWYDHELDSLEVQWDRAGGAYASTNHEKVMEYVDDSGKSLGFMIEGLSSIGRFETVEFQIGANTNPQMENTTVNHAAEMLNVTVGRVRQLCTAGRVKGAKRVGRDWLIPLPIEMLPGTRGRVGVAGTRPTKASTRVKAAT